MIGRRLVLNVIEGRRYMSVMPSTCIPSSNSSTPKKTLSHLCRLKSSKTPITMSTATDYPSARVLASHPSLDIILVGDSLAQTTLGLPSTLPLTLSDIIHHSRAVVRGIDHSPHTPFVICDMPFGSFHLSLPTSLANAVRVIQETEAKVDALKFEGAPSPSLSPLIQTLSRDLGIPVVGHIGLQPQKHLVTSGYKVQARDIASAKQLLADALELERLGCSMLVVECVPAEVGEVVSRRLKIPVIGIGAGKGMDGQVLVWDDYTGGSHPSSHTPKFVRKFADVHGERMKAVEGYVTSVKDNSFPSVQESYKMGKENAGEWEEFTKSIV